MMDDPAPLRQQELPEDMILYEHEIRWAHTIKRAVHEAAHLQPISDYEVAEWALVTQERQELAEVLDRIYRLQYFRGMYKFENVTPQSPPETLTRVWEEGAQLMHAYLKQQQPGHLLTIDFLPSQGNYLIVWDRASFSPARVQRESDWRVYQGCTLCLLQILNTNLAAVREGISVMLECDGMKYFNYDSKFEERRVNELFNYFPFKTKEFCFLHAPTVAIMLYKAVKPFMRLDFTKAVKLDGNIEGFEGRIDTLYNVPNLDYAQDRLLERLQGYLRERLLNQRNFTLPPAPFDTADDNGELGGTMDED